MATIDWPAELSQTYVNVDAEGIRVDDDHQAHGQVSAHYDPATARQLAGAHRQLADALDAAADHLGAKATTPA